MNDRLYRSRDERIIAGVAGGVAERFDVDPSLVRIVWVILAIVTGSAFFWLYIVMAIVVPEEPTSTDPWASWTAAAAPGAVPGWAPPGSTGTADADWGGTAAGSPAGPGAAGTAAFAAAGPPDASSGEPLAGSTSGAEGSDVTDVALPGEPAPAAASSGDAAVGGVAAVAGVASAPPPGPSTPPPGTWSSAPPPGWNTSSSGRQRHRRRGGGGIIGGVILILLGGYFLLATLAPQLDLGAFWPAILVIVGVALVVGSIRPGRDGDHAD